MKNNLRISPKLLQYEDLQEIHPDLKTILLMADTAWLLNVKTFSKISYEWIYEILLHEPIFAIQHRSKYFVIGGFRTWQILKVYGQGNKISTLLPVQLIEQRMNSQQRKEFAIRNILLTQISHSLGTNSLKHLGDCWMLLEREFPDIYQRFFIDGKVTKSRLPAAIGKSYESLYPSKNES